MDNRTCSVSGCARAVVYATQGLCKRCYNRARAGRPLTAIPCVVDGCDHPRSTADHCGHHRSLDPRLHPHRFAEQLVESGDCWQWQGAHNEKGYGLFRLEGRHAMAHRWSYEYHRAEIPDGLVIDHLCRNHGCVNPWHLEPVTIAVNTQRGYWGDRTECGRGHEFTSESTITRPDGSRYCRTCHNINRRRARAALLARA